MTFREGMGAASAAFTLLVDEGAPFCFATWSFACSFACDLAILLAALEANTSAILRGSNVQSENNAVIITQNPASFEERGFTSGFHPRGAS